MQYQAQRIKDVIDSLEHRESNEHDMQILRNEVQSMLYEVGGYRNVESFPTINGAIAYLFICMLASGRFGT